MAPGRPSRKAKDSGTAARVAAKQRTPRKKKPTAELIGKRISINYPGESKNYEARVIDYDPKSKFHKLFYFEDDSIEELSMSSKRKWELIEETVADPDPQGATALLGKTVILPVNASKELNPAEPISDFRAVVVEILDDSSEEEDGDAGEDAPAGDVNAHDAAGAGADAPTPVAANAAGAAADAISPVAAENAAGAAAGAVTPVAADKATGAEADATNTSSDVIWHRVVYLANDCLATVNMNDVRYTIVDSITGELIRVVNADKGQVDLDKPEEEVAVAEPAAPAGAAIDNPTNAPVTTTDAVTPSEPRAPASAVTATPSQPSAPAGVSTATSTTATPVASATPTNTVGSSSNKVGTAAASGSAGPSEAVAGQSTPTSAKRSGFPSIGGVLKGLLGFDQSASTPSRPVEPAQTPDASRTAASSTAVAPSDSAAMAAAAASEIGTLNTTTSPKPVASVGRDMAMDVGEPTTTAVIQLGSTGTNAGALGNGETPAGEPKPLTENNLNMHDSEMNAAWSSGASAPAPGAVGNDQDDEIQTISDAEVPPAGRQGSDRTGQNLVNSYVKITQEGNERIARVEAYLAAKKAHLVSFYDETGGSMQLHLTKDNFRTLTKEEASKIKPHDGEERPKRTYKRKNGSESAGRASKRSRQTDAVATAEAPGPGAELIGTCITIQWPGNGGNYFALVVGFQDHGLGEKNHKVYYIADESTEVVDLSQRTWSRESPGTVPWDRKGLVGKRLYVLWPAEYDDAYPEDRRLSEEFFGKGQTKVPYEAFVVQFIDSFKYKLLYTQEDNVEDRKLTMEDSTWDVLEPGSMKANGMSIISWSSD